MSTFSCPIVELQIKEHPNADAIEIAEVGLFQSIVKKGQYKSGELAVYIPENTLIPEQLLRSMDMWDSDRNKGRCGGAAGNRVKPIKLRGVVSQGLICPLSLVPSEGPFEIGDDVSALLGTIKHEQVVPAAFRGQSAGDMAGLTPNFDVENLKKSPWVFEEGEAIRITEKLHGTCCIIGVFPEGYLAEHGKDPEKFYKGRVYVGTKNLTKKGIVFNPNKDMSIYTQVTSEAGILEKLLSLPISVPYVVMGEIFGPGVQDLHYGLQKPEFRAFEGWSFIEGSWRPWLQAKLNFFLKYLEIPQVPVFYEGPYQGIDHLKSFVDGVSTLCDPPRTPGAKKHTREGIVVRGDGNGKLFKLISNDYLFRKGEQTEYE